MATFPTLSLPPTFPLDETYEDNVLRNEFEKGYELTRARHTKIRKIWTVNYKNLTDTDISTFRTFYTTTLKGSDEFTWINPINSTSYSVKFQDVPKISPELYDGTTYRYTLTFNIREV